MKSDLSARPRPPAHQRDNTFFSFFFKATELGLRRPRAQGPGAPSRARAAAPRGSTHSFPRRSSKLPLVKRFPRAPCARAERARGARGPGPARRPSAARTPGSPARCVPGTRRPRTKGTRPPARRGHARAPPPPRRAKWRPRHKMAAGEARSGPDPSPPQGEASVHAAQHRGRDPRRPAASRARHDAAFVRVPVPLLSRPRGFLTQSTELRPPVGRPPPRTPLGPGAPAALAPARPSEDGTGGLSGPLPDAGNARGKAPYTPHARASAATLRPNVLSPLGRAARSRQRADFGSRSTCKLPASALGFPSLPRALSALLVVRPPGGCAQAEEGAVPVLCPPSARVSAGGRALRLGQGSVAGSRAPVMRFAFLAGFHKRLFPCAPHPPAFLWLRLSRNFLGETQQKATASATASLPAHARWAGRGGPLGAGARQWESEVCARVRRGRAGLSHNAGNRFPHPPPFRGRASALGALPWPLRQRGRRGPRGVAPRACVLGRLGSAAPLVA